MTTALALPLTDEIHRQDFARFVQSAAHEWYKEHLGRLYAQWVAYNRAYFDGQLPQVPYITFGTPGSAHTLGLCANISNWGGRLQITIRRSLIDGKYKRLKPGEAYRHGREKFVDDVLLHEMVHQLQMEVLNNDEPSYKGHGPLFAAVCNRIGDLLDIPHVRPAKARGKQKAMPSCAQWPTCVRPPDYYEGAYDEPLPIDENNEESSDETAVDMPLIVPVTDAVRTWLQEQGDPARVAADMLTMLMGQQTMPMPTTLIHHKEQPTMPQVTLTCDQGHHVTVNGKQPIAIEHYKPDSGDVKRFVFFREPSICVLAKDYYTLTSAMRSKKKPVSMTFETVPFPTGSAATIENIDYDKVFQVQDMTTGNIPEPPM